jgi:hypothetical protein
MWLEADVVATTALQPKLHFCHNLNLVLEKATSPFTCQH